MPGLSHSSTAAAGVWYQGSCHPLCTMSVCRFIRANNGPSSHMITWWLMTDSWSCIMPCNESSPSRLRPRHLLVINGLPSPSRLSLSYLVLVRRTHARTYVLTYVKFGVFPQFVFPPPPPQPRRFPYRTQQRRHQHRGGARNTKCLFPSSLTAIIMSYDENHNV